LEEIEKMEHQLNELKVQLKQTSKHIEWKQLDEKEKFYQKYSTKFLVCPYVLIAHSTIARSDSLFAHAHEPFFLQKLVL
jgi:hypothetical protein